MLACLMYTCLSAKDIGKRRAVPSMLKGVDGNIVDCTLKNLDPQYDSIKSTGSCSSKAKPKVCMKQLVWKT